jgi:hypothetical protein
MDAELLWKVHSEQCPEKVNAKFDKMIRGREITTSLWKMLHSDADTIVIANHS